METITITFGDCAENHVGMQKIGLLSNEGFNLQDFTKCITFLEENNIKYELIDLVKEGDVEKYNLSIEPAYVLIIRNGIDELLGDESGLNMFKEQRGLLWDTRAKMYGRVVNKHARYNLCYSDDAQEPRYDIGQGRIVSWDDIPITYSFKEMIPKIIGDKGNGLVAEGNFYYDNKKCGIGFHGDAERKKVIAVRLGECTPLHYQWYNDGVRIGDRVKLNLCNGDIYIMSEKATGWDWKKKKIGTLRHAAGSDKFLI